MKTTLLEAGRWIALALALVLLISMGAKDKTSGADPEDVVEAVAEAMDMTNLQPGDNQMIKRLYGLQPADYEGCELYYPLTNMDAEELLVVKLKSADQQQTVRDAIEKRLETQKNSFDGYGVGQFDLLTNHCQVEVRGNYVLFVVSPDDVRAKQAFLDAL